MYAIEFLLLPNFPTMKHRRLVWEFGGLQFWCWYKKICDFTAWYSVIVQPLASQTCCSLGRVSMQQASIRGAGWFHYEILRLWGQYWNQWKFPWQSWGLGLGFVWNREVGVIKWSKLFGHFCALFLTMDKLIYIKVGVGSTSRHHYRSSSSLWHLRGGGG